MEQIKVVRLRNVNDLDTLVQQPVKERGAVCFQRPDGTGDILYGIVIPPKQPLPDEKIRCAVAYHHGTGENILVYEFPRENVTIGTHGSIAFNGEVSRWAIAEHKGTYNAFRARMGALGIW